MSTGTEHLDRILELAQELETLLERLPPAANASALSRVQSLCRQMTGADRYITGKAARIEALAARYLSARKHATYAGEPFALRDEITTDLLNRIRQHVGALKNG